MRTAAIGYPSFTSEGGAPRQRAVRSPQVNRESLESPWTSSRATSIAISARPSGRSQRAFRRRLLRRPRPRRHPVRRAVERAGRRRATSGVNVAEEYGGGGGGLVELAHRLRGDREPGRSAAAPARLGGDLGRGDRRVRLGRAAQGVAARASRAAGRRSSSRSPSRTRGPTPTGWPPPPRATATDWVLRGTKHYISGVDEAEALMVVARTGRGPTGSPQLSLFVVPTDAPGLRPHPAARRHPAAREAVRAALRRRARAGRGPGRRRGRRASARCSTASTPSGSPERRWASASPATPCGAPPSTPPPDACGTRRSAPTRASPTRSPRRRSRPSWPR